MKLLLAVFFFFVSLAAYGEALEVCSFNIQFLGHFKKRDDQSLAHLVRDYDIVVVQELVAPPVDGIYPDGNPFNAGAQSKEYFDAMASFGFEYHLSDEDTGTNDAIHKNSTATEWWVVFFKPEIVEFADDLPHGFLAEDRSNNDDFERVPYAFPFRTMGSGQDFVLISVHLEPDGNSLGKARRKHELAAIDFWVTQNSSTEKDFIILGDMNIQSKSELIDVIPSGWTTLNADCLPTNTHPKKKPYDHVMVRPRDNEEVKITDNFEVINLIEEMKKYWILDVGYAITGSALCSWSC
ncbi:hypothetical protein MLD52_09665 [Puniceicoccaceae bacterium K14]|nr:hypothetical protein [Puniceicoccaceae bacterium K14]